MPKSSSGAAATVPVAGILPAIRRAEAFTLLKMAGALYLIWLGLKTWRQARITKPTELQTTGVRRGFREGILVEALNPKTAFEKTISQPFIVALMTQAKVDTGLTALLDSPLRPGAGSVRVANAQSLP